MKQGWISVHRQLQEHWLWKDKPFSKGQAWIDLLMLANHADNKFLLGNELIEVKAGSFITSELKLMERWGWGKTKVRSFLDVLQSDGMIVKKTDRKKTTIIIENYSVYQDSETTDKPQTNHSQTTAKPPANTNNNDNNDNNENNENKYNVQKPSKSEINSFFDSLWQLYPVKKGKGQVSEAKRKKLYEIGEAEMKRAINRYLAELKKDASWRKPQNGGTFFNSGYVDYLDDNFVPQETQTQQSGNGKTADMLQESYDMMDEWAKATEGMN